LGLFFFLKKKKIEKFNIYTKIGYPDNRRLVKTATD